MNLCKSNSFGNTVAKDITLSLNVLGSFNTINLTLSPSCICSYLTSLCDFNKLLYSKAPFT